MLLQSIFLNLMIGITCTTAQSILTLTASLPGSPLDGQAVNAGGVGFSFELGGSPAFYCPSTVEPYCPNTTETIFTPGLGALDVLVPGGQQVYINSDGLLGFTEAHSAYVPPGSYYDGFINMTVVSDCAPAYTVLTWKGASSEGILACPLTLTDGMTVYQVYANTLAFNQTGCTKLNGLLPTYLPNSAGPGAWQYV